MEDWLANLNQNQTGAVYSSDNGTTVTGSWRQDEQARGALSASGVDLDYQITVELNQTDKTFTYKENLKQSESHSGFNPSNGKISFGKSTSTFSGKSFGAEKSGYSHHFGGSPEENKYSYSLENERIKQPLLNALTAAGYTQKKSFLGKLFGN